MINEFDNFLEEMGDENRQIIFSYLAYYSRMEYALKKCDYILENKVLADWERFIKETKGDFNKNRSDELSSAIDFLFDNPPDTQELDENSKLIFKKHKSTINGSEPLMLYHCLRIVRNNLFHGGKYPGNPMSEVSRDIFLIKSCTIVLVEFIKLRVKVYEAFIETA